MDLDLSAFEADGFVDLSPRTVRQLGDVVFGLLDGKGTAGRQMMISFAPGVVDHLGDRVTLRWWPSGHLRVGRGEAHNFALRKLPNSGSRSIRCQAPAGLVYPGRYIKTPADWMRNGMDVLIAVPPLYLGDPKKDGVGDAYEALDDTEDDQETAPKPAPEPAKTVKPKPTAQRPSSRPAKAPASAAEAPKGGGAPDVVEFEVIHLGSARVRTSDLPALRDLAAGKEAEPSAVGGFHDWERLRAALRDERVLLPIGGGRLTPQGKATLAKLICDFDRRAEK